MYAINHFLLHCSDATKKGRLSKNWAFHHGAGWTKRERGTLRPALLIEEGDEKVLMVFLNKRRGVSASARQIGMLRFLTQTNESV